MCINPKAIATVGVIFNVIGVILIGLPIWHKLFRKAAKLGKEGKFYTEIQARLTALGGSQAVKWGFWILLIGIGLQILSVWVNCF